MTITQTGLDVRRIGGRIGHRVTVAGDHYTPKAA
jgi:hypothetical protein